MAQALTSVSTTAALAALLASLLRWVCQGAAPSAEARALPASDVPPPLRASWASKLALSQALISRSAVPPERCVCMGVGVLPLSGRQGQGGRTVRA